MHLGYKACGFETIKAVDHDHDALETLCRNNPEDAHAVERVCVNEWLSKYKPGDSVQLLHASTPCHGASKANRHLEETEDDEKTNELILSFPAALSKTQASIGVFENVGEPCFLI